MSPLQVRLAAAAWGFAGPARLGPRHVDIQVLDLKILQSIFDAAGARPLGLAHMCSRIPKFHAIVVALVAWVFSRARALTLRASTGGRGRQVWVGPCRGRC